MVSTVPSLIPLLFSNLRDIQDSLTNIDLSIGQTEEYPFLSSAFDGNTTGIQHIESDVEFTRLSMRQEMPPYLDHTDDNFGFFDTMTWPA